MSDCVGYAVGMTGISGLGSYGWTVLGECMMFDASVAYGSSVDTAVVGVSYAVTEALLYVSD